MNGKSKCKILKDIRQQIAKDNDIEYVTSECKFQGECSGTCPKCEAELRYLENELQKRQKAGKAVAVAGIAAALVIATSACTPDFLPIFETQGDLLPATEASMVEVDGDISYSEEELMGEPAIDESTQPTEELLMGDIVLPE